jgi:hypothetical protein
MSSKKFTIRATCTNCSQVECEGFYCGCLLKEGHDPENKWDCDGKGNLTREANAGEEIPVTQSYDEYPEGSWCPAIMGGGWLKMKYGWKWNGPNGNGGTFPTPRRG